MLSDMKIRPFPAKSSITKSSEVPTKKRHKWSLPLGIDCKDKCYSTVTCKVTLLNLFNYFCLERGLNSGPSKGIQNEITKRLLYLCAISPHLNREYCRNGRGWHKSAAKIWTMFPGPRTESWHSNQWAIQTQHRKFKNGTMSVTHSLTHSLTHSCHYH